MTSQEVSTIVEPGDSMAPAVLVQPRFLVALRCQHQVEIVLGCVFLEVLYVLLELFHSTLVVESFKNLADEDLLEMVNAGLIPATVTFSQRAQFWSKVFPRLVCPPEPRSRERRTRRLQLFRPDWNESHIDFQFAGPQLLVQEVLKLFDPASPASSAR